MLLLLLGSGPSDSAGRSQLEWGATVPLQTDSLGGGAGMGRWVSHTGSIGSWAVGRCRVSAGAPIVREMAVRGRKGREMEFRELKVIHFSCLQPNYYQVMRLQKHDDNDMSKSIGKYELPIIIK